MIFEGVLDQVHQRLADQLAIGAQLHPGGDPAFERHACFFGRRLVELGYVGGKPDAPASAHAAGVRTDPQEARAFVAETGVDALAVAVGSSHAMTSRTATLDRDLIAALRETVPVPLVLHGSSGVPDDELRAAVAAGMAKINVGTALNVAFTAAVRATLERTDSPDPRKYLAPARDAMAGVVADLLRVVSA